MGATVGAAIGRSFGGVPFSDPNQEAQRMRPNDFSALLPDGRSFDFWEREPVWDKELFVSCTDPAASDENDGSPAAPFRTIGRAAKEAANARLPGQTGNPGS